MENNHETFLRELFPNTALDRIEFIISVVNEQFANNSNASDAEKIESMINLLLGNEDNYEDIPSTSNNFAEPSFGSQPDRIKITLLEKIQILKEMLPNADPSYLEEKANILWNKPDDEFKQFIDDAIENENYPKMEDYLKKLKCKEEKGCYTKKFCAKAFLEEFPNPEAYFGDPSRQNSLRLINTETDDNSNASVTELETEPEICLEDEKYALNFLLQHYVYLREVDIQKVFNSNGKNLYKTCKRLDCIPPCLKKTRKNLPDLEEPDNIALLQEIAFLKHKKLLLTLIKKFDEKYQKIKDDARKNDLLQTCGCCYDDELIPEECFFCNDGCIFCKQCVKKGAETLIGEGKLKFPCLSNCGSEFCLTTLQMVLDKKAFSKLFQHIQIEEIKQANLDGLESCPFCDFAVIPSETDKVFCCENPDCMKKTCRQCHHEAHIPIPCNEMEYDEDVKMRTYIEEKMTNALLRECWQCGKKFYKDSGCNKMTCSCKATMCYICKQPVKDYTHFGEIPYKCPLYTKDLEKYHEELVENGGLQAKTELGIDQDPEKLKKDPMKMLAN